MVKSSSTIQIYQKLESSLIVKAEKSPSSAGGKNSSETPTPTISHQPNQDAFNSSDIVRIYVPPSDDMMPNDRKISHQQRDRGDDEISQCSNRSSIVHVEYETLPYDISPTHTNMEISDRKSNHNNFDQGKNHILIKLRDFNSNLFLRCKVTVDSSTTAILLLSKSINFPIIVLTSWINDT